MHAAYAAALYQLFCGCCEEKESSVWSLFFCGWIYSGILYPGTVCGNSGTVFDAAAGEAKELPAAAAGSTEMTEEINLTAEEQAQVDEFAKQIDLNKTQRGDLLAIRSAGAYGEIMASQYNCRKLPLGYMSDEL